MHFNFYPELPHVYVHPTTCVVCIAMYYLCLWTPMFLFLVLYHSTSPLRRSWNVWLFASCSSSPMLAVYNRSLASIGTRPSHMEEGLVPIPVSDCLCTVLDYSNRLHMLLHYFLLHFWASSFKTYHLHECVHQNLYPQNVWYVIVAYRYRLLRAPSSYMCAHTLQVKVCHVSNATRLWVSLLQHSPRHRGEKPVPCHDPFVFVKLTMDLAQFYSSPENKRLHG